MDLLDALKDEKPLCYKKGENLGVTKFVREHFDRIKAVRDKGYSWRQIADAVNTRCHFDTKKLPNNLASGFNHERRRRERHTGENLDVAKFVREHFDRIKAARDKGYSWRQIADAVNTRCHFDTKKLPDNLTSGFNHERRRRERRTRTA